MEDLQVSVVFLVFFFYQSTEPHSGDMLNIGLESKPAVGEMKDLKGGRVNLHSVHHCLISPEGMQNVGEGQEEKGRREKNNSFN